MDLISLSCNKCGAPLEVPERAKFVTCSYRKSRLAVHTTGSVAYTEVLENTDHKTTQILEHVETIGKQVADIGTQWELCEIGTRWGSKRGLGGTTIEFYAAISGPRGTYSGNFAGPVRYIPQSVGQGRVFPKCTREAEQAVNALSHSLTADGWEYYATGEYWWGLQFRRRFK